MIAEEWRPIPGYELTYEASALGRIRSLPRRNTKGCVLRSRPNAQDRYQQVNLCQDGKVTMWRVHILIARTFLGERPDGLETRHLDGDRDNNSVENLAYGSHAANMGDMARHGTHPFARKTHCPQGHEYSPENTGVYASGRICLTCNRARSRMKRNPPKRLATK